MASLADDLALQRSLQQLRADGVLFPNELEPGVLLPQAQAARLSQAQRWTEETDYSEKYCDDVYEYRRVTVPRAMLQMLPHGRCMEEAEWRSHGITMSRGWEHYDHHSPEANVLLFRRVLGTDPKTGLAPPEMLEKVRVREAYTAELEHLRQKMVSEQAMGQDLRAAGQL